MYVKIINGFPTTYSVFQLKNDNPDIIYPREMSDEFLETLGIYRVNHVDPPTITLFENLIEGEPELVDDKWYQTWVVENKDINSVKAELKNLVNEKLNQQFQNGFTVPFGTLEGEVLQTRDVIDRTNWLTSQASYSAAVAMGYGEVANANFRTLADNTYTVTFNEGLSIILEMGKWGAHIMGNSWNLKDSIKNAETIEELKEIDIEGGWDI